MDLAVFNYSRYLYVIFNLQKEWINLQLQTLHNSPKKNLENTRHFSRNFLTLVGPSRRHRYRRNWAIRLHHAFSPRPPLAGESGLAEQFEVTNIAPEGHFWPETIRNWLFLLTFPKGWLLLGLPKKKLRTAKSDWGHLIHWWAPLPNISLVARNGEGLFDEVHPSLLHEDDQN